MLSISISNSISSYQNSISSDFLPNEIPTLDTWFESFDTNTIQDTSNFVDQLNDKSGNGYNAVGTGSTRPLTNVSTLNGNNVLDFASDRLILPSGTYGLANGANTIVVVAKGNQTSGTRILYSMQTAGLVTTTMYLNSSNQVRYKSTLLGSGDLTANDVDINSYNIMIGTFDGVNTQTLYVNGVMKSFNNMGNVNPNVDAASIGGTTTGGSFNGSIAAVLTFTSELTTEERQNVEGYLAWKLQGN